MLVFTFSLFGRLVRLTGCLLCLWLVLLSFYLGAKLQIFACYTICSWFFVCSGLFFGIAFGVCFYVCWFVLYFVEVCQQSR